MRLTPSALVQWDRTPRPDPSVAALLDGTVPGFQVQDRDLAVLEGALRYAYLTAQQVAALVGWTDRHARRRCAQLAQLGLLDRAVGTHRTQVVPRLQANGEIGERERPILEHVFALAQKGFDLLVALGHPLATAWAGQWHPRSRGESRKLAVAHELERNDFCLALIAALRRRGLEVAWKGSREAAQRIPPAQPGGAWHTVEPDGLLLLESGVPLLVELERTARVEKLLDKLGGLRGYFAGRHWQDRYLAEPWVLYAVLAATRRRVAAPGGLWEQVRRHGMRRIVLLDDLSWREGHWMAWTWDGREALLWEVLGLTSAESRPAESRPPEGVRRKGGRREVVRA